MEINIKKGTMHNKSKLQIANIITFIIYICSAVIALAVIVMDNRLDSYITDIIAITCIVFGIITIILAIINIIKKKFKVPIILILITIISFISIYYIDDYIDDYMKDKNTYTILLVTDSSSYIIDTYDADKEIVDETDGKLNKKLNKPNTLYEVKVLASCSTVFHQGSAGGNNILPGGCVDDTSYNITTYYIYRIYSVKEIKIVYR